MGEARKGEERRGAESVREGFTQTILNLLHGVE